MRSKNSSVTAPASVPRYDMQLGPDTDGAALAAYRQNVELLYRLDIDAAAAVRFYSRAVTYQLPNAMLARVESVAQTLDRGPAEIARGGDQLTIYVQVSGELDAIYAGRRQEVRPGDVVIIDYTGEIHSRATDFCIFYLLVPRDRVPPALFDPSVHGTVFPAASGPGRFLYRTIETLLETVDSLTLAEAEAAVDAVLTMLAGALDEAVARQSGSRTATGDVMLDRALAFIDRTLGKPDLSPAILEANLPVSRSSLYRLFAPLGGIRNVILQRRLERAMKALLSGDASKPPLRAIARDHGFRTEQQLSRAFRTRFGVTPYQFHDMVRRRDHAGLASQAERAGFANLQAWIEFNESGS